MINHKILQEIKERENEPLIRYEVKAQRYHADIPALVETLEKAVEVIKGIQNITGDLQPNSGHMYLSDINIIDKKARKFLAEWEVTTA